MMSMKRILLNEKQSRKKVISIALFLGVIPILFLIQNNFGTHSKQTTAYTTTVYINGSEQYQGALITKKGTKPKVIVPLIKTLSSLGADVRWEDHNIAILRYKKKEYEIDLNQITLMPLDDTEVDLLLPLPGGSSYRKVADNDIFINYALFSYIAGYINMNIISSDIDDASQCLTITIEN